MRVSSTAKVKVVLGARLLEVPERGIQVLHQLVVFGDGELLLQGQVLCAIDEGKVLSDMSPGMERLASSFWNWVSLESRIHSQGNLHLRIVQLVLRQLDHHLSCAW